MTNLSSYLTKCLTSILTTNNPPLPLVYVQEPLFSSYIIHFVHMFFHLFHTSPPYHLHTGVRHFNQQDSRNMEINV